MWQKLLRILILGVCLTVHAQDWDYETPAVPENFEVAGPEALEERAVETRSVSDDTVLEPINAEISSEQLTEPAVRTVRKVPAQTASSYRSMLNDLDISAPEGTLGQYSKRKFPAKFCDLQKDTGVICPGLQRGNYLEEFFYDSVTNRCDRFVYNGCGGNANRFSSMWECTQSCARKNSATS